MATFRELKERAEKLKPHLVRNELFNFIRSIEKELVAYNQATIYEESQDIRGRAIGFYTKATENITNGRKKAGEPYNLKETGVFLDSLHAKVQGRKILFYSTDKKKKKVLENLLNEQIFGLQDQDLFTVIDRRLIPKLQNYYRKGLGL